MTKPYPETWIVALDGAKALIFRNEGFDDAPNLQLLEERAHDDPPDRALGTDRPGRTFTPPGGRAAMQETDDHALAEDRFVKHIAQRLDEAAREKKFERLVIFADARSVGRLRDGLGHFAREKLAVLEGADLVSAPMADLDKAVVRALKG